MIICWLALVSHAYSFVTDYSLYGPLRGWTTKPGKEHFFISTYFQYLHTNESFDSKGDLRTLKEYLGLLNVNPSLHRSTVTADVNLGLTPSFGVQVVVPYIVEHSFRANEDAGYVEEDIPGDTGFGDVDVGVWFVATPWQDVRLLISGKYHITSGTSPYTVTSSDGIYGINQPFASGTGYSYVNLNIASDVELLPSLAASFFASCQINQSFSEDGCRTLSRMGNIMMLGSRVFYSYKSLFFSLGLHYAFSADNVEQDIVRRESGLRILTLLPQFGFAIPAIGFIDSVHFGYTAPLSGKNQFSPDFVIVGIDIKF